MPYILEDIESENIDAEKNINAIIEPKYCVNIGNIIEFEYSCRNAKYRRGSTGTWNTRISRISNTKNVREYRRTEEYKQHHFDGEE